MAIQWEEIQMNHPYRLIRKIREGPDGIVYTAENLETKTNFTIKLVLNPFENYERARQVYREIKILNKLSEFKNNIFTPTIYDIILPQDSVKQQINEVE